MVEMQKEMAGRLPELKQRQLPGGCREAVHALLREIYGYEQFRDLEVYDDLFRGKDTLQIPMELGRDGKLGVYFANTDRLEFAVREYSFAAAIPAGIKKGVSTLNSYVKQLKLLFSPEVKAYKSVGGVMSMGNIFPGVWDWQVFWELTAFISIMLAVVNILPVPALDGGHVLFLLYEVITRRKPGEKFLEYAQVIGMIFLIALFILVNVNDVVRFFG